MMAVVDSVYKKTVDTHPTIDPKIIKAPRVWYFGKYLSARNTPPLHI